MRIAAVLAAVTILGVAGPTMACPMQSAAKSQTVASGNGDNTPLPPKSQQPTKG